MTDREQQQADLLADYRRRLAADRDAAPPAGLDPGIAALAMLLDRRLRPDEPSPAFTEALHARLETEANGLAGGANHPDSDRVVPLRDFERDAVYAPTPGQHGRVPHPRGTTGRRDLRWWVLQGGGMAAAAVLLLGLGLVLSTVLSNRGSSTEQLGGQPSSTAAVAPTQTPAMSPTVAAVVSSTVTPAPSQPAEPPRDLGSARADVQVFNGMGRIALASDGRIGVLFGGQAGAQIFSAPEDARSLIWSRSGRWLAFLSPNDPGNHTVWLADAEQGQTRQITEISGQIVDQAIAWSPADDRLAVGAADGLWLISPDGAARQLAAAGMPVGSVAWSPDGNTLAFTATPGDGSGDVLFTVPVDGSAEPRQQFVADGNGITLAGWWSDGQGVLFWQSPAHSSSLAADGLPLESLALGSDAPRTLATTVLRPDWVVPAPDGHTVVVVAGAGRWPGDEKHLERCDARTGDCATLPLPDGSTAFDPAFSPDGTQIAYVVAPRGAANGADALAQWNERRALWIADADGSNARQVEGVTGAAAPRWTEDGQRILYWQGDAVRVIDLQTGADAEAAAVPGRGGDPASPMANPWGLHWGDGVAWYPEG